MYRSHYAAMLVFALLLVEMVPAVASPGTGHDRTRTAPVAVLLDLEGAQASLGRPAMNGFLLGLQQGGAYGPVPFTAMIDTQSDPETTQSAARNIVSHVSFAAGFTDNDSVLIAGPFFQRARVPLLSIGATDPALPEVIGDSIFLTPFGDNTQAAAAAEFGHREFGGSAAILWDATAQYTRTLPRYFRTRFEELGGSVVLDASYEGGCDIEDLGQLLEGLEQQPDFVYLAGLPDCIGDVVASLRTAGVSEPIMGGDGLDTPDLLMGNPGPTDDVWFTTHAWLSEQSGTPEAKAFIAAYRDAYGAAPADAFAALGYDAARLMLDALQRARNRNKIAYALEHTKGFKGVTGTIAFSSESHVPLKTVWIIKVQNGVKHLADAFVPEVVPPPIVDDP